MKQRSRKNTLNRIVYPDQPIKANEATIASNKRINYTASKRDYRQELGIPEGAFFVASAGRLIPEKGILPLAEAITSLESHSEGFATTLLEAVTCSTPSS